MKFDEYLNSKGKVETKPEVKLDGDCIDPSTMPNAPSNGGKPYVAKDNKTKKSEKALGDQGDEDLVYEPSVDNKNKGKAPAKIPTVEHVGLVNKLTQAIKQNPLIIENLVRSIKHQGQLGLLVAEALNHRDTYKFISEVMAHESYGPEVCNKLARAMNEETAAPFSDQLDVEDEEDSDSGEDIENGEESNEDMPMDSNVDDMPEDSGEEEINAEVEPDMGEDGSEEMGPLSPEMFKDHPAVHNLQKALMRAYMRRMMDRM